MKGRASQNKESYMPAIDGLRTLAVFAVIFYHLGFSFAPGGFLGVTLFFVLSGYLITNLLLNEWDNEGRISLSRFWIQRAKRLLPGLFVLLITLSVYVTVFRPDVMDKLRTDLLPAVFYYSNWWDIFHKISYFNSFGMPPLLKHLWSLAVEEQFYIIWPLLLVVGFRFLRHRKDILAGIVLLGAFCSAWMMSALYVPDGDPSRVYYGTDTRAFSLLLGSAMAFLMPSSKLLAMRLTKKKRLMLNGLGIIGLIAFFGFVSFTDEYSVFLYRGGMFLFSIFCALLIIAAAHPQTMIAKWFKVSALRRPGAYSYEIYLFQYPVIVLSTPLINTDGINIWLCTAQLLVTLAVSWLVYYFIDNPIRRRKPGTIKPVYVNTRNFYKYKVSVMRNGFIGGLLLVMVGVATFGLMSLPTKSLAVPVIKPGQTPGMGSVTSEPTQASKPTVTGAPTKIHHNTGKPTHTVKPPKPTQIKPTPAYTSANTISNARITVIGDSIMLDVWPYLTPGYPHMEVSAEIGFQIWDLNDKINEFKQKGKLGDIVIIELGTNGTCTPGDLKKVLQQIGPNRSVIFCNTRIAKPWQNSINRNLNDAVKNNRNTFLADWFALSAHHNEYFIEDGVHPNAVGSKAYAAMLRKEIEKASTGLPVNQ